MKNIPLCAFLLSVTAPLLFGEDANLDKDDPFYYSESMGLLIAPGKVMAVPQYGLSDPTTDLLPYVEDGWMLGIRLQNDLTSRVDRNPATFNWTDDRNSGNESAVIDAALIFDIYAQTGDGNFLNYNPDDMAFRITAGAEWERNDGGGDSEQDIRRYTFGGRFNAFPNFLGKTFAANQPFEFGVTLQEDLISDTEHFTFDIGYQPNFTLPFMKNLLFGGRSYFQKDSFMKLVELQAERRNDEAGNSESKKLPLAKRGHAFRQLVPQLGELGLDDRNASGSYFFFRPDLGVELGEGDSLGDIVDNFTEGNIKYGLETGFGIGERIVISYALKGLVPFDSDKPNRVFPGRVNTLPPV